MTSHFVQKNARLLRALVYAALAVNIICIPLVPFLTLMQLFVGKYTELAYWLMIEVFYWVCGGCTAVILWQAKRILDTILAGEPFQIRNSHAMGRAAVACWVISAASLVRFVVEIVMLDDPATLFSYNTVFVPCFFMAGLLFRVMAALFQQAAELREDQELTI